jgi:hypothetical protein
VQAIDFLRKGSYAPAIPPLLQVDNLLIWYPK